MRLSQPRPFVCHSHTLLTLCVAILLQCNEWKQTVNPVTMTTMSSSRPVEGYEAISTPYTAGNWGGLEYSNHGACFLDGWVADGSWFYAVGLYTTYGGGYPAFYQSDPHIANAVELYVGAQDTASHYCNETLTVCETYSSGNCKCGTDDTLSPCSFVTHNPKYERHEYSSVACSQGRLDSPAGWCAGINDINQWMQLDLGAPMNVAGVVTQGREEYEFRSMFVTGYTVSVSNDGSTWAAVNNGEIFPGNSCPQGFFCFPWGATKTEGPGDEKVSNYFETIATRYVRIGPKTWNGHIVMRAGVIVLDDPCQDTNECSDGTDNCNSHATCTNVAGSFICECGIGYAGDGVTCECDVGFAGDPCTDVDECAVQSHNCNANAKCENTVGSFWCTCNPGYVANGDRSGTSCVWWECPSLPPPSSPDSWCHDRPSDCNRQLNCRLAYCCYYGNNPRWHNDPDCNISLWDTSEVTSMSYLFSPKTKPWTDAFYCWLSFNEDISQWDTSSVTDMSFMFGKCDLNGCYNIGASAFNADIGQWDVSSVTNMAGMFSGSGFNGNIGQWDVSKVTQMQYMFMLHGAWNTDDRGTPFGGPVNIGQWDVSSVADMEKMFSDGRFSYDISKWNISSVTNMDDTFSHHLHVPDLSKWDTSSVTRMKATFYGANFGTSGNFNACIGQWNTASVADMSWMFCQASFLGNQDISQWDVSKVVDMNYMFYQAPQFNANIGQWNVSKVTNMQAMFASALHFNANIGQWDVSKVTNMHYMFGFWNGQHGLMAFNADISKWNVLRVVNFNNMFSCSYCPACPSSDGTVDCVGLPGFRQSLCAWGDIANRAGVTTTEMFYDVQGFNVGDRACPTECRNCTVRPLCARASVWLLTFCAVCPGWFQLHLLRQLKWLRVPL